MTAGEREAGACVVEIRPRQDVKKLPLGTVRGLLRRTCLRLDLKAGTATWDAEFRRRKPVTMQLPGHQAGRASSSATAPVEAARELVRFAIVESQVGIDAIGDSSCQVMVFLDRDDKAIAWSTGLPIDVFDKVWSDDSFAPLVAAGVPVNHEAVSDNWDLHKKYPPAVHYARFLTLRGLLCIFPVIALLFFGIPALYFFVLSGS